jgi:hypothetical protein
MKGWLIMNVTNDDELLQFGDDKIAVPDLEDLSDELLTLCIEEQIKNPFMSTSDYLEEFKESYKDELESAEEDIDGTNEINQMAKKFYDRVLELIDKRFGLQFDESLVYGMTRDSLQNFAEGLYEFFIVKYSSNLSRFICIQILENKDDIAKEIMDTHEGKDVTSIGYSTKIENATFATILANIHSAINIIRSLDISPKDFIDCFDEDIFSVAVVKYAIENNLITGDFVDRFIAPLFGAKDTNSDFITVDVQQAIYKKYLSTVPEKDKNEDRLHAVTPADSINPDI